MTPTVSGQNLEAKKEPTNEPAGGLAKEGAADVSALPPRSLPQYGINSKDVARQYGLPEDFYGTADESGVVSSKYRTKEYDAAIEAQKRAANIQGINGTTIRRQAREQVELAFKEVVENARRKTEKQPTTPTTEPITEQPTTQAVEQTEGQTIVGMGGAVKGEFTPPVSQQTSIKNAAVDRDRIARGEKPMMAPLAKSDPELWSQAMNIIDNNRVTADKLIARFQANPFIPTDVETTVLLHRRTDLKNEWAKLQREYNLAEKEGRTRQWGMPNRHATT